MISDDTASRLARGELLLEHKVVDGGSEGGKELRTFLKNLDKGSRTLNPKSVARMGDASQAYVIYCQVSSDSAHPTISSLGRHIIKDESSEINQLNIPPAIEEDEIAETISFICSALLGACYATGEVLGKTLAAPDVKARMDEFMELQGLAKNTAAQAFHPC